MPANLSGTWIRSNDGLIIRVTQENNDTIKSHFPNESITYTLNGSLLKTNKKDKDFHGDIINERIIQWKSKDDDGKFNKFFEYLKDYIISFLMY